MTSALGFGYWAVAQFLEPARLETDDTRRGSWSPYPYRGLMLRHTILPTALAKQGYSVGVPDGLIGLTTRQALRAWQQAQVSSA